MKSRTLALLLLAAMLIGVTAAQLVYTLAPGDTLLISCASALSGAPVATNQYSVACASNTPTPSPLPPTATLAPTATLLPPTATLVPPSPTAPALPLVDPAILGTCTAAIHDRYVVTGPDGHLYRTWHPQTVPIDPANPAAGTCTFAHEHGDNPALSLANSSLPAFGYVGALAGFTEGHEGYKVYVINAGQTNDEGRTATTNTRLVIHMGTDAPARFDTSFHSAQFDLTAPDGHYVHVSGMFDTGVQTNICANPRPEPSRAVLQLPGTGCNVTSLYEIWGMRFDVGGPNWPNTKATVFAATAAFGPITLLDPNSLPGQRPLLYSNSYFPSGPFFGCDRETYHGPVYWYNATGPTTYLTDAYGNLSASGPFVQQVSNNNNLGIPMNQDQTQMKLRTSFCAAGLGLKN